MDNAIIVILLMTIPALVSSLVVALNAKKLNADYRRKRDARRAAAVEALRP